MITFRTIITIISAIWQDKLSVENKNKFYFLFNFYNCLRKLFKTNQKNMLLNTKTKVHETISC